MSARLIVTALAFAAAMAPGAVTLPARAQDTSNSGKPITVFAAASVKNALDAANKAFSRSSGSKVVASYAATSALVKQIEAGAPADVFLSADLRWMDYAAEHKLIKPETRAKLLGNRLVLIAPRDSKLEKIAIVKGFDIAKLAGDGRIAIANVKAVPAGRYAKTALESLGVWPRAAPRLAQAQNVRAALAYVARGETAIGIVYATDAMAEPKVKVVGVFPEDSHPPIIYPVAVTAAASKPEVGQYMKFLRTQGARSIFERFGFSFLIQPVS